MKLRNRDLNGEDATSSSENESSDGDPPSDEDAGSEDSVEGHCNISENGDEEVEVKRRKKGDPDRTALLKLLFHEFIDTKSGGKLSDRTIDRIVKMLLDTKYEDMVSLSDDQEEEFGRISEKFNDRLIKITDILNLETDDDHKVDLYHQFLILQEIPITEPTRFLMEKKLRETIQGIRGTTGASSGPQISVPQLGQPLSMRNSSSSSSSGILEQIRKLNAPPMVKSDLMKQYQRMNLYNEGDSEFARIYDWLNFAVSLPYNNRTEEQSGTDLEKIVALRKELDDDVYGMKNIKGKMVENYANYIRSGSNKGYVFGIYGSPGTGKTSIAKSFAKGIGRPSYYISVGGLRHGNRIKGDPDVYVGAGPSEISLALSRCKVKNCVIILDEIDKIDPQNVELTSSFLELFDQNLNSSFTDLYLKSLRLDLSEVIFICIMNETENLNPAFRSRVQPIKVDDYTDNDISIIIKDYLIPKISSQFKVKVELDDSGLEEIIFRTRKFGKDVRYIEKYISDILKRVNLWKISKEIAGISIDCPENTIIFDRNTINHLSTDSRNENDKLLFYFI